MSRAANAVVGLGLAGVCASAVLGGISLAPELDRGVTGEDLSVSLAAPRPYRLDGWPQPSVHPARISGRLDQRGALTSAGAGIGWQTWSTTYGHRWTREVAVPLVQGPLHRPEAGVCGFALRVQPELLDTRRSPALQRWLLREAQRVVADINQQLAAMQRDNFAAWTSYRFQPVVSVPLRASSEAGALRVRGAVDFGHTRQITLDLALTVRATAGSLTFAAGPGSRIELSPALTADLKGQVADDHPLLCALGGILDACGTAVDAAVATETQAALVKLTTKLTDAALKLRRVASPLPGRPNDRLMIDVMEAHAASDGVSASFCLGASLAGPLEDPSLTGFPLRSDPPPRLARRSPTAPPGAQLAVSVDGLNQLLFIGWQAGALGALGRSPVVLEALPAAARQLAFDVTALTPRLPPQLGVDRAGAWRLAAPSVKLGAWGGRDVVGHAALGLGVTGASSSLRVTAALDALALDCEQKRGARWVFTPCVSDLLPAIRETTAGARGAVTVDLGDALSGLVGRVLEGARIDVGGARAELGREQLELSAAVQFAQ